ncbi:MAG TPA: hypothetical protein VNJ05_04930 [Sphingomicrobium sp.]|nr:hypothetical protein [Sphingomicrobium sp.]
MLSPIAYWLLLFAVSAYAFARGRLDERLAAMICIVATLVTWLFNSPLHERFSGVEVGVLAADALALVGFTFLALRSDRFWPLWVAGLQLTTLLSHGLKAIEVDLLPQAYAAAARFWVYPIFLIIVIGTWRSHQRRRLEQRAAAA